MFDQTRRDFCRTLGRGAMIGGVFAALGRFGSAAAAAQSQQRKFTMDLVCGSLGVRANQREAVDLAARHGFESVGANAGELARMSAGQLDELRAAMKEKGIVWGAAGLPVDFRGEEQRFLDGMKALPNAAAGLQRAGVTRVGTWLSPTHAELTYLANFRRHVRRLREVAQVLGGNGLRFGLEYVGPKTSWSGQRYPFVHTMAEAKELIATIDRPNVGLVLDSWHWYTSGETKSDLLSLKGADVVAVDLNDAPAGIPVDQQMDLVRELPSATGVIDVGTFLGALVQIGYDGPVRAEPFSEAVRKLPPDEAVALTAAAMRKAFGMIGKS